MSLVMHTALLGWLLIAEPTLVPAQADVRQGHTSIEAVMSSTPMEIGPITSKAKLPDIPRPVAKPKSSHPGQGRPTNSTLTARPTAALSRSNPLFNPPSIDALDSQWKVPPRQATSDLDEPTSNESTAHQPSASPPITPTNQAKHVNQAKRTSNNAASTKAQPKTPTTPDSAQPRQKPPKPSPSQKPGAVSQGPALLKNPNPPYPRKARIHRWQSNVELWVMVNPRGRAEHVKIAESSGHQILDDAARKTVADQWRFSPAKRGGHRVSHWVRLTVRFRLKR